MTIEDLKKLLEELLNGDTENPITTAIEESIENHYHEDH